MTTHQDSSMKSSVSPSGDLGASNGAPLSPQGMKALLDSNARFTLALLLVVLVSLLTSIAQRWEPNTWLHEDGAFYMNTIRSVLEKGTLRQEQFHPHSWYEMDLSWNKNVDAAWSNIGLGRHGEWWPKHPILMPLCALPFVWAMGPVGSLVFHVICLLFVALFTFRIASTVAPRPFALAATLLLMTSPWISSDAWAFNNDVFYTALVLASVDQALRRNAPVSGALLGLSIFAKATNVLYAPAILGIFLLRREHWRVLFKFCVAAAVPCAVYALSNAYLYGAPWRTGYDVTLVRVNHLLSTHSHREDFALSLQGFSRGLWRTFFDHRQSMEVNFPAFFISLLGLAFLAIRRPKTALPFLWMILTPVVFHAPFRWYRADFLLPAVALSMTPLSCLFSLGAPPYEAPPATRKIHWGKIALVALPVLLIAIRLIHTTWFTVEGDLLWDNIKEAHVMNGKQPCDYFNNQHERWECTGVAGGSSSMTGRSLKGLKFHRSREKLLLAAPTGSSQPKIITFPKLKLSETLNFRMGISEEGSKKATAKVELLIDGDLVLSKTAHWGKLETHAIKTQPWKGKDAEVKVRIITLNSRLSPQDVPLGIGATVAER